MQIQLTHKPLIPHPPNPHSLPHPTHFLKLTAICFIILLYPLFVGYTIFLAAAASFPIYKKYYHINFNGQVAFIFINGIVPMGGMAGSMLLPYLMPTRLNKINICFFNAGISLIACCITLIPYFQALMIGRFILGIICSFENSVGASLIRDFILPEFRALFGGLYVVFRMFGMALAFIVGVPSNFTEKQSVLILIFMGPAIIAFIQMVLIKPIIPRSPAQLVAQGKIDEARIVLARFYAEKDLNSVMAHYQKQFKKAAPVQDKPTGTDKDVVKFIQNIYKSKWEKRAFFISQQTSLLRQFCGVNYVILLSTFILIKMHSPIAPFGPIITAFTCFLSSILGVYFSHVYPRRSIILPGCLCLCLICLALTLTLYYQLWPAVFGLLIIYMIFCGAGVISVAWSYPPQVIPVLKVKYNSLISWAGSTIVAMTPVYAYSWPVFAFITVYLFVTDVLNYFFFVQSKGKIYSEVVAKFKKNQYR